MDYLTKEKSLFQRDEEGKLIPQIVTLELIKDKPVIKAIPLKKGQIQKLLMGAKNGDTTKDQDNEVILQCCIEPKYTEEDVIHLKPNISSAIVMAILSLSTDISQKEIQEKTAQKVLQEQDYLIKKK